MPGKRKVPGGFAPKNTLHQPSSFARSNQLPTVVHSGYNVVTPVSNKRRRLDHEDTIQEEGDSKPDEWFHRTPEQRSRHQPQPQPQSLSREPSRQESVISVRSQDASSQDQRFRHSEFENVSRVVGHQKKRSRKPKSSSAANSQTDFQELRSPVRPGTSTAPFAVEDDDDDDPQITRVTQSARRPPAQRIPRAIQSSPIRQPAIEVKGYFATKLDEQASDQNRKKAAVVEAPLRDTFVRAEDDPKLSSQPQTKFRNKMRATSVSKAHAKLESSEDELASSNNLVSSSVKRNTPRKSHSSLPASEIKSSRFFNTAPKIPPSRKNVTGASAADDTVETFEIPLHSILTQSVRLQSDTLTLHSVPQVDLFAIQDNGKHISNNGIPIRIAPKHIQRVSKSVQESNGIAIVGARDEITGGKLWLDFNTRDNRDDCLTAINSITRGTAKFDDVNDARLDKLHESMIKHFLERKDPVRDPELLAMQNRQSSNKKPPSARDRAIANQQGFSIPEPEIQITPRSTRKAAMKSEFAHPSSSATIKDSSPQPEVQAETPASTRSSRRLNKKDIAQVAPPEPEFDQWTKTHGVPRWESPLVYPANGMKRTTVDAIDLERLDDGEFLNDNIISFYLRYLEEHNAHLKDQVYIFNTFFYSALSTNKQGRRALNYDAVKRWTKNVDLFKYPMVVVPVNANLHWFLIIICNLDKLEQSLESEDEETEGERDSTPQRSLNAEIPESPQNPKEEVLSQRVERLSLDATEQEENNGPSGKSQPASRKVEKKPLKADFNVPSIITLDSLGQSHSQEVRHLKEYVSLEGADKRGLDFKYSALKGVVAKGIPHQTNFYDCGVYLVGYICELLKNPNEFVRKVLSRELDVNNDFAGFDPTEKRVEIRDLLLKLAEEQKEAKKARKKEAYEAKKATQHANGSAPAARSSPIKSPIRSSQPVLVDGEDEMLMDGSNVGASVQETHGPITSSFFEFASELQQVAAQASDDED